MEGVTPPRRAEPWQACGSECKDIFQAKANKVLDKAEDPRETLDLSYEKQLDSLQKVRRSVADVATARKRIELQATQLQKQADKLQTQAKAALAQGNEDLAREALARRAALGEQLSDLKVQHDQVVEQEEQLVEHLPAAPGPGRAVPDPQGDAEGELHGRRGPDQGRRGGLGHLDLDGRRRAPRCSGPRTRSRACRPGPGPSTSSWPRAP